jgi:hypothetical protein
MRVSPTRTTAATPRNTHSRRVRGARTGQARMSATVTRVAIPEACPLGKLRDSSRAPPWSKSGRIRPKNSFSRLVIGPMNTTAVSTHTATGH